MTYKTVYNISDVDHRLRARITDGTHSCISRWRRKPGAKAQPFRPRNNPNNERIYRGRKFSNGRVSVRKHRYYFQPFDTVIYRGNITAVKGVHCNDTRVMLENGKSVKPTDLQLIKHKGGWQFLSA